jgi:hypothetical protein
VVHACNPCYSGDRDEEDHSSKPASANSSQDSVLKKPITKNCWRRGKKKKKGKKNYYNMKKIYKCTKNNTKCHHFVSSGSINLPSRNKLSQLDT